MRRTGALMGSIQDRVLNLAEGQQTLPRTQAEIARGAGVTEVTVRNRSKELRKKLGMDRPITLVRREKFLLPNQQNIAKDNVVP